MLTFLNKGHYKFYLPNNRKREPISTKCKNMQLTFSVWVSEVRVMYSISVGKTRIRWYDKRLCKLLSNWLSYFKYNTIILGTPETSFSGLSTRAALITFIGPALVNPIALPIDGIPSILKQWINITKIIKIRCYPWGKLGFSTVKETF